MRVLIFGDSIAQGYWDPEGGWADRIKKHYIAKGLEDIHDRNFTEVFNLGISGDTTNNLLARVQEETKARKWPGESQTAIIAIGTNDDALEQSVSPKGQHSFGEKLENIIQQLDGSVEHIILVGNPACDESQTTPVFWAAISYTNGQLQRTEQIVSEIAAKHSIPFIPIFDEFKRRLEAGEPLLEDGLHPSEEGHKLIFELVRPVLDEILNT